MPLFTFIQRANNIYILYKALNSTSVHYEEMLNNILVPNGLQSSFSLSFESSANKNIKSISLSNNKDNCLIELNYNNSLTAFANNNKVGFFANCNPDICYTSKSKNFCSRWNNSIYGQMLKIPSFLPDDLSYKKITSFLTAKKLMKASLALGIGDVNINIRELTDIISVSDLGTYPINNNKTAKGRRFRIRVSKNNFLKFFNENLILNNNAELHLGKTYAQSLYNNIKNIKDNYLNIDIVIYQNKIKTAKLLFDNETKEALFYANNKGLSFTLNNLNKNIFKFHLIQNSPQNLIVYISSENSKMLNIKKYENNAITAYLSDVCTTNNTPQYKLTYTPINQNTKINAPGTDMYNLSVLELYSFMKKALIS